MTKVKFQGKTYTLTQEAEATNYGTYGEVRYCAVATDDKGNQYEVIWETKELWDLAVELAKLEAQKESMEQHNEQLNSEEAQRLAELSEQVNSSYCEDESNACDWDNPIEVKEI